MSLDADDSSSPMPSESGPASSSPAISHQTEGAQTVGATQPVAASQPEVVSPPPKSDESATQSSEPAPFPQPRLKIGSQRPGSAPLKARPQVDDQTVLIPATRPTATTTPAANDAIDESPPAGAAATSAVPPKKFPPPNRRTALSPEMLLELEEAMGGMSVEDIVEGQSAVAAPPEFAPEARVRGRVVTVHRADVFVDLGGRNQGVLPLTMFPEPPEPGTMVECIVNHRDPTDGLYALSLPGAPIDAADWTSVSEGVLVDARITGHNKGGLECVVNNLRGFIPASQISMYRVEDLAQFVEQKMVCLVTEVKPEKRNLVLSRRAVLEREAAEAKEKLLSELAPGQVREGIVRSLRDFGAFIDLGGVDGLLHVSQLSWARVKHPSDVLQEGQKVTVKIQKIDPDTGKIGLAMKELTESPWANVAAKYPVRSKVTGTVSKIMDFGAFVQLEPGVEGLVHISELAHQRVFRVGDIVSEGQEVEAQVMSVDPEKQRIGLSIKAVMARPEPAKKAEPEVEEPEAPPPRRTSNVPLKGGIGRSSGGDQFGLKW
jgi:small subunit ribosomal protein S1